MTTPPYPGDFGTIDEWQDRLNWYMTTDFGPHLNDILSESIEFAHARIKSLMEREDKRKGDRDGAIAVSTCKTSAGVATSARLERTSRELADSETPPPEDDDLPF